MGLSTQAVDEDRNKDVEKPLSAMPVAAFRLVVIF